MSSRAGHGLIIALLALVALVVALALLSLLVGAGDPGMAASLDFIRGDPGTPAHTAMVVESLRAPRALAAIVVGVALGGAGTLLQTITRNPLAEPGLLGVNAGASLAVVAGMTFFGAQTAGAHLAWAFTGAMAGSIAVLLVASINHSGAAPLRLVLAGVALGSTFQGLTAGLLLAHQSSYDEYRFWIMGSLASVSLDQLWITLPAVLAGLVLALLIARPLSALSLGDDTARALGHRPAPIRIATALAVTLLTASAVALAGPIALLGLLAPHVARATGPLHLPSQLLLSGLAGAAILLAADVAARVVVRPFETPASVLVALVGAPLLVGLVRGGRLFSLQPGATR